jgi:hypothetical protein
MKRSLLLGVLAAAIVAAILGTVGSGIASGSETAVQMGPPSAGA